VEKCIVSGCSLKYIVDHVGEDLEIGKDDGDLFEEEVDVVGVVGAMLE
jgi:hypothetical protein